METAFEQKIIKAPGRCQKCRSRYISPTTGVLSNTCHCGGELVHEPQADEIETWLKARIEKLREWDRDESVSTPIFAAELACFECVLARRRLQLLGSHFPPS